MDFRFWNVYQFLIFPLAIVVIMQLNSNGSKMTLQTTH